MSGRDQEDPYNDISIMHDKTIRGGLTLSKSVFAQDVGDLPNSESYEHSVLLCR